MSEYKLHLGDCLEYMRGMEAGSVDAVVTDPPYPDALLDNWDFVDISFLQQIKCRQLVFWSALADFPISKTGCHIWAKDGTGVGKMYERIFERNGSSECLVFRGQIMNNYFNAKIARDKFFNHPAQKPVSLLRKLIERVSTPGATIFDPFMGSGTTGVACMQLGRNFIGCEIDPNYYAIAERRIEQASRQVSLFAGA